VPRFSRTRIAAAIALIFSGTNAALAQESTPQLPEVKVTAPPDEGFKTEVIRGATRTDTPLRDIPQFVNVIPQEIIRSQQAASLTDALRNVPGITYGAAEGGTQANQVFFLRGFQAVGDLYIDGVRDLGEYNRDLFATDSVEVLKGPSALAFGRGSPGGVVNQIPKYAEMFARREVSATFGSHGEKRLVADLNQTINESTAVRLVALGEDSNTYRDTIDNRQLGFAPSLRLRVGQSTDMTLAYYYLNTRSITDYGQPTLTNDGNRPPPVSLQKVYGFADYDYSDWETNIATFKIDHRLSDDASLRNTLRWANYKRSMEATIGTLNNTRDANGNAVTANTPSELLLVDLTHNKSRDNDDSVLINQTDFTWHVATGSVVHTLLGGMELAAEDLDRKNYTFTGITRATTSLVNPDNFLPLSYTKTPNQRSIAEADTVALYVQDQVDVTSQWKALLGVRWDHIDSTVRTEDARTGNIVANGGPFSRVDKTWSGRAGVIWQPTQTQSYYIAAGNSYNPSGQLGVYGSNGTSLDANNDDLDPEENRSYEIGSQWDIKDVQVRAAIFRNEKINQRIPAEPGTNLAPILGGKRRVDGVELSASGRITPNWDLYGAMAWMSGEIVKSNNPGTEGNEPYGVPQWSGNVWTVYRLGGGWEIGGGANASSSWWLNDANTGKAPSYMRWDATFAYVQPKYEVRLNLINFTDAVYYVGGYENSGNRVIPGLSRTALLTGTYRF
jgi:catecholate siderophore receptor